MSGTGVDEQAGRRRWRGLPSRRVLGVAIGVAALALVAVLSPVAPWATGADAALELARATVPEAQVEAAVTTPPTTVATTTTVPPPTTTTVPPTTTTTAPPQRFSLEAYRGLGAWMDVYDWSATYAKYGPALGPESVDALAAAGVQTLFIQASKWDSPTDVLEPNRLKTFIAHAHNSHVSVVAWFLPTLEDPGRDLQRLRAIAALPIDGIAVDIEARNVSDVAERNRRLVALSAQLRKELPGEVIGAIPVEPVVMEDVNPHYWPGFPWAQLAPSYDVWLPMGYWTNRVGGWRDAYTYTAVNIDKLRARIGRPDAPVHALGGIGDKTSVQDLRGFWKASAERHVIGGSIYDFRTTQGPHWPELQVFRKLRR